MIFHPVLCPVVYQWFKTVGLRQGTLKNMQWHEAGREWVRVNPAWQPSRETMRVNHPEYSRAGREFILWKDAGRPLPPEYGHRSPGSYGYPSEHGHRSQHESHHDSQLVAQLRAENERLRAEKETLLQIDRLRVENHRLDAELRASAPSKLRTTVAASRDADESPPTAKVDAPQPPEALPPAPSALSLRTLTAMMPQAAAAKDSAEAANAGLEAYEAGGCVPLSVKVAECEAVCNAISKFAVKADAVGKQLKELEHISSTTDLTEFGLRNNQRRIELLKSKQAAALARFESLESKFRTMRFDAIAAFTPQLLRSVLSYEARFSALSQGSVAEATLNQVEEACKSCQPASEPLRQTLSSSAVAHGCESLEGLFDLMAKAQQALPAMQQLCECVRACGGEQTELKLGKLKGIPRCLQKVQEDYEGDYTRLLDIVRATLIFDTLPNLLRGLRWLLGEDGAAARGSWHPRFEARKAKDRLSLAWDAELSGGYRDVVVVGEVEVRPAAPQPYIASAAEGTSSAPCAGAEEGPLTMLVEVQLHLRPLFELKHDLHTVYTSTRVLGAAEDDVALHAGQLTADALGRARKGIVRRLHCDHSPVPSARDVAELLQGVGALLELKLAGPKAGTEDAKRLANDLEGWTIERLLLTPTPSAQLECTRLQTLVLARRGLTGPIPEALCLCVHLQCLGLNGNALTGGIPASIGELGRLIWLYLNENALTGSLPRELARCRQLQALHLHWNKLSGPVSTELIEAWSTRSMADGAGGARTSLIEELHLAGNTELVVSDAQRAAIEARSPGHSIPAYLVERHLVERPPIRSSIKSLSWPEALEPPRTSSLRQTSMYKLPVAPSATNRRSTI